MRQCKGNRRLTSDQPYPLHDDIQPSAGKLLLYLHALEPHVMESAKELSSDRPIYPATTLVDEREERATYHPVQVLGFDKHQDIVTEYHGELPSGFRLDHRSLLQQLSWALVRGRSSEIESTTVPLVHDTSDDMCGVGDGRLTLHPRSIDLHSASSISRLPLHPLYSR